MIYIVEDDRDIRELETYALRNSGYEVVAFENSTNLYKECEILLPNLILLDIMLPIEDGLTILKNLRANEKTKRIPVIMVTAKSSELDKVKGLDLGADDYITKPFDFFELCARIRVLLRREFINKQRTVKLGTFEIDITAKIVKINDKEIDLTPKEYSILEYLIENIDKVISSEEIIEHVWDGDIDLFSNTLKYHISSLRKKLQIDIIQTVRGFGYVIKDSETPK